MNLKVLTLNSIIYKYIECQLKAKVGVFSALVNKVILIQKRNNENWEIILY